MAQTPLSARFGFGLEHSGVAAIDIRDGVVHLVHVTGRGRKASRALFRQETIDASLHPGDPIAATAAAIARAAHGLDLSRIPATIVLPNSSESLVVKRFPKLSKKALASAIELAHASGTSLEGSTKRSRSFVQSSGADEAGQRFVEAVLVEATESAVGDAERLARGAGVRLARVTSAALALGRALVAAGGAKGTVLVVDLTGPQTVLNTYTDGKFVLSREADVAADLLSDQLGAFEELIPGAGDPDGAPAPLLDAMGIAAGGETRFSVERQAAAATASAPTRADETDVSPDDASAVSPQKLRIEIVRSNRYLTSHYRRPIERVYFAGAAREARALASRIAPGLGVPVELIEPRSALAADAVEGHPSSASARCFGAALEMLAPPRASGYQFLVAKRGLRSGLLRPEFAAAAACLVVIAGALAAVRGRTARADATLAALRGELRAATAALVIPGAQLDPARVESRLTVYRMLRDSQPRWSPALTALAECIPDDAWLTDVGVEAGDADDLPSMEEILAGIGETHVDATGDGGGGSTRIVVTGRTHDLSAVSRFLEALAPSDALKDARVLSVTTPDPEALAFEAVAAATNDAAAGAGVALASRRIPYEFSLSVAPSLRRAGAARAAAEVAP